MEIKQLVEKEFYKWEEDPTQLWESCDVKDFAIAIAENVIARCILVAKYPQLNDEQSYYGNMFAEYIKNHFEIKE